MPYVPTNWSDNVTQGNHTTLNNLETQYLEATNSFEQDLFTAFVFSGLVCTKDGTTPNQLDVTSGIAFLTQSDGTERRRAPGASTAGQFTTATPSTTYYLFLNNDGTWTWGTASTGPANSLAICQATTDGSGNILAVSDKRVLNTTLLSGMAGSMAIPNAGLITFTTPLSAANQMVNLQQGYGIYSDNVANTFGGATNRLWINAAGATGTQEVHVGPRAGVTALAGFRVLANNVTITNNGTGVVGTFAVSGPKTSLDAGAITTDGNGNLTAGKYNWGGGVSGSLSNVTWDSVNFSNVYWTPQAGANALGHIFVAWNGSAQKNVFSVGGQFAGALSFVDNVGNFTARNYVANGPATSSYYSVLIPSSVNDENAVLDITDATTSAIHWLVGKQSHANGDFFRVVDATNGVASLTVAPNGAGLIGGVGYGIPTTRNGSAVSAGIYTGANTPTGNGTTTPATGALWAKA